MKALVRAGPSGGGGKSVTWGGTGGPPVSPRAPASRGEPSKKNEIGTCRIREISCSRPAPIRLVPFSYFCTCWNVNPMSLPSSVWLISSIMRRMRTRLPTCLSVELGDFLGMIDRLQRAVAAVHSGVHSRGAASIHYERRGRNYGRRDRE